MREIRPAVVLLSAVLLSSCTSYGSVDGVDNLWREAPVGAFEKGVTTQSQVLDELGPPSQLINLQDQTVFYYLTENMTGKGRIFIFWNSVNAETRYDRAIFFFDTEGVLQEYAFSKEEISR
jgi:outer membrane protein assembly factor BamE (lipoprotein component of BamABCDE complex)